MLARVQGKVLTPQEQCAALEKLFSNLPRQTAGKVPHEKVIPAIVRELMFMAPHRPPALRRKRLKQLVLSIADTMELIGGLSESDLEGHNYLPVALKRLKDDLYAIHTALKLVQKKSVEAKTDKGRPKNLLARRIAWAVAMHYSGRTGKESTRNNRNGNAKSPYQELLAAVYEILGVKANAEHYLRLVPKERKLANELVERNRKLVERNRKIVRK
jgi:hypothetical protein